MSNPRTTPRQPRPAITEAPPWTFPTPTISSLDNGLELWEFHLPGQHVIALDLEIDLPLSLEAPGREGVANVVLSTSDEGTRTHPGAAIAEVLEDVGAVFGGAVDHEATTCTIDVPSTRLASVLPLFAEIVTAPEHNQADIDRHIALRLANLEQLHAQGSGLANLAIRRLSWDQHSRRSRPSGGLANTVTAITRDDVVDFHARHWKPAAGRLMIGGHLTGIDVPGLVAASFGDWAQPSPAPEPVIEQPLPPTQPHEVFLVDRPGAVQVDLRISGLGVDRHHDDFAALQIATVAVGGSFMSRLNRVLREERGYTYGISLGSVPYRQAGQWTFSGSFRTEVAVAALVETLDLLDLSSAPLTEAEVADSRTQIIGLAPLRYDTPAAVIGQAARLARVGLDTEQVNRHYRNVAAVTATEASEAFGRHIGRDRGHIVMVGDATGLRSELQAAGFTVCDLALDQL